MNSLRTQTQHPLNTKHNHISLRSRAVPTNKLHNKGISPPFLTSHNKTAQMILNAVKSILLIQGITTSITPIGHGYGGAFALLDSIYLPVHLPSGPATRTITYGMPRVGNKAFADYVDSRDSNLHRIINRHDPFLLLRRREKGLGNRVERFIF